MTCSKSKSTGGDHCRHGVAQTCCWCGEAAHGPFMPSNTFPSNTGYTCVLCGVWVSSNALHYCPGYKPYFSGGTITVCTNPL